MSWLMPGAQVAAGLIQGRPELPKFKPISVEEEQRKAIQGNIENLPGAEKLATSVNAFNQAQLDKMLEAAIPGFGGMKEQISGNISDWLAGKVPEDVSGVVERSAAGKALAGGYGGSAMQRNLTARDLGLTSLDLMGKGVSSAESWMKTAAAISEPTMFNVSSMFISPTTQLAQATSERNAKFQYDWNKELIDWQSSFKYLLGSEMAQNDAALSNMVGSVAGSVAGGAAGGGGGGGL